MHYIYVINIIYIYKDTYVFMHIHTCIYTHTHIYTQVAEALCDVIDCVAAQHGQRIHMHQPSAQPDSRRTSFPSRPDHPPK